MSARVQNIQTMIDTLPEEDYIAAVKFIEYLVDKHKKDNITKSRQTLADIQAMFADDKSYADEDEMLRDMADFRRKRQSL